MLGVVMKTFQIDYIKLLVRGYTDNAVLIGFQLQIV